MFYSIFILKKEKKTIVLNKINKLFIWMVKLNINSKISAMLQGDNFNQGHSKQRNLYQRTHWKQQIPII